MSANGKSVVWFKEVNKCDVGVVGGKGANLGEMTNDKIPVPPGFIVSAAAYIDFLKKMGIEAHIRELLDGLDVNDSKQLQRVAGRVQQVVLDAALPDNLAEEIRQAYAKMGKGLVAVRSSATAEDLPEASFAGQQATFLNIEGDLEVVKAVQRCGWFGLGRNILHGR